MASRTLAGIVRQLRRDGRMRFFDGATDGQIADFEKNNGLALPERFKEWLRFSDGGDLFLPAGVQLYGVAHDPVIDVNDPDSPDPDHVVIGCLSFGDPVLCARTGEEISVYNLEGGRFEDGETYPDFFAFLEDLRNGVDLDDESWR